MSNIIVTSYNYKRYLKPFIRLFSNIYQYKVVNIILRNSNLCTPHKNKVLMFTFPILNLK